ncbi:hypothetical protein HQ489_00820 [Candidatus Woesearchaeota archaeon]|nr:hypothetical protein [Candidatus Woesearchaeota archaeon]
MKKTLSAIIGGVVLTSTIALGQYGIPHFFPKQRYKQTGIETKVANGHTFAIPLIVDSWQIPYQNLLNQTQNIMSEADGKTMSYGCDQGVTVLKFGIGCYEKECSRTEYVEECTTFKGCDPSAGYCPSNARMDREVCKDVKRCVEYGSKQKFYIPYDSMSSISKGNSFFSDDDLIISTDNGEEFSFDLNSSSSARTAVSLLNILKSASYHMEQHTEQIEIQRDSILASYNVALRQENLNKIKAEEKFKKLPYAAKQKNLNGE